MAGKNAGRAEELLQQHRPSEQVRPGCRAEREQEIGLLARSLAVAVGGADHEARFANAAVTPAFELAGESFGCQLPAALVEQDGAARRLRVRNAPARVGQLGQLERPGDAPGITLDQLRLGRTGDLSAGNDVEEHGRRP